MLNEKNFIMKITALSKIYGGKLELDEVIIEMYYQTLNNKLTEEEFSKAVSIVLETRKYSNFPTPAEFIEIIKGNADVKDNARITVAGNKFIEILHTAKSIRCDDPFIVQVLQIMGGIDELRKEKRDNEKWLTKEFKEKYEVEITRKLKRDLPIILYTSRDLQALENEIEFLPPKLIGEKEKYLKWTNKINEITMKNGDGTKRLEEMNGLKKIS